MDKYVFPSVSNTGLTMILGMGETGIAAANWCAANGAKLRLVDTRAHLLADKNINNILSVVDKRFAANVLQNYDLLEDVHTIVISPGLNPYETDVAALIARAQEKNIDVIGEIELFARALKDLHDQGYKPLLFTVTGTNGKTTVSSLLGHLLRECAINVRVAGNISPASLASLLDALQQNDLPQAWVLELSSFQLHTTRSLMADAAVVLNISQDHLDWHGSMVNYVQDKAKILQMSKIAVINRSDPYVSTMVSDIAACNTRSFGADVPKYAGDLGLYTDASVTWLALALSTNNNDSRHECELQNLIPAQALQIIGQHNVMNALAALCMLFVVGMPIADVLHGLRTYRGEAHRTEFVRTVAGVDFIDDSKGTNVGATVAALKGINQPIILIAGGLGKGQDFTELANAINQYAKKIYLIGKDAGQIEKALAASNSTVQIDYVDTLELAVNKAFAAASAGDAILLSPACASMDMFKNYVERSECFVRAVQEIALDHGEFA